MKPAYDLATGQPVAIIRAHAGPGERVLWADRAVSTRSVARALPSVVFGLFFGGFGALWTLLAWAMTQDQDNLAWRFFPLFGIPFACIGLVMATSPLWRPFVRGVAIYGLTDERILSVSGRKTLLVRSTSLADLGDLQWVERKGGMGDILFARGRMHVPGDITRLGGLFGVPNVRRVAADIERARSRMRVDARPAEESPPGETRRAEARS